MNHTYILTGLKERNVLNLKVFVLKASVSNSEQLRSVLEAQNILSWKEHTRIRVQLLALHKTPQ